MLVKGATDATTDSMKIIIIFLKNWAAGWDDITLQLFEMIGHFINHPLVYIRNLSLQ